VLRPVPVSVVVPPLPESVSVEPLVSVSVSVPVLVSVSWGDSGEFGEIFRGRDGLNLAELAPVTHRGREGLLRQGCANRSKISHRSTASAL
jgi:hypothetical protein